MDNPVSLIISRLWYVSFDFLLQYIIYLDLTSFLRSAVSYDHHFLYCIIHFDVPSYGFSFLMTPFIMIFFLMTLRAILSIHYLRFTASDLPSQMYHCLWSFCLWSFCTFLWLSFSESLFSALSFCQFTFSRTCEFVIFRSTWINVLYHQILFSLQFTVHYDISWISSDRGLLYRKHLSRHM